MSSSRTPNDKMNRYLQRIEKLVGHRGKSPVLPKSRTRSPINVKTSRIDNYLKYELFTKAITEFCQTQQNKLKYHFLTQLINSNLQSYK